MPLRSLRDLFSKINSNSIRKDLRATSIRRVCVRRIYRILHLFSLGGPSCPSTVLPAFSPNLGSDGGSAAAPVPGYRARPRSFTASRPPHQGSVSLHSSGRMRQLGKTHAIHRNPARAGVYSFLTTCAHSDVRALPGALDRRAIPCTIIVVQ